MRAYFLACGWLAVFSHGKEQLGKFLLPRAYVYGGGGEGGVGGSEGGREIEKEGLGWEILG